MKAGECIPVPGENLDQAAGNQATSSIRSRADWFFVLSGVFLIAGIALRGYRLSAYSLWQDEAHSWWLAELQGYSFWNAIRLLGVHPPLYFLLLREMISVVSDSEAGLRVLSLILGTLSISLAMLIGWQVGGKVGCIAAGWFWAFHPMAIWYSQEARPYALAAFLSLCVTCCFLALSGRSPRFLWLGAVVTLSAGLLTHFYFFVILIIFVIAAFLQVRKNPGFFRSWTLASLLSMVPMLVWLVWFFRQPTPSFGIGWISHPLPEDLFWTPWNLLSGYAGEMSIASMFFGLIAIVLALAGLVYFWLERRELFYLSILWPFALLGAWVISYRRPIYMDRYFIVLLPLFVIMVSGGAGYLYTQLVKQCGMRQNPPFVALLCIVMVIGGVWGSFQIHRDIKFAREDWKGLVAYLDELPGEQPPVFFSDPESEVPFLYYDQSRLERGREAGIDAVMEYWWVLRQPYTMTHAFAQAVSDPDRPWEPDLPEGCQLLECWESLSGIAAWKVHCE